MNVEHEILEQLLDDDWPLSKTITFLTDLGEDAWQIIARHAQEGNLALLDSNGSSLPDWKVREIVRSKNSSADAMVQCTDKGARIVT